MQRRTEKFSTGHQDTGEENERILERLNAEYWTADVRISGPAMRAREYWAGKQDI